MLIDSHAHLDMNDFQRDREEVLDRAFQSGIVHIISVGIDVNSSVAAIDLARTCGSVSAAVGCHPHNAETCNPSDLETLADLASDPEVVAWGEIGLDYFRGYARPDAQIPLFQRQLRRAEDLHLPVVIHDREAHDDVYAILKRMGKGERKGVIHCFSGDLELATAFIDLGYFISIPGTVTYKKAEQVKDVAASIPMDRMLVETDAPFLAPVPRRGKRNEPAYVRFTAMEIARLRSIPFEELGRRTTENARYLFGLSGSLRGDVG